MEKICVLGLGYIGLPTATLASTGGLKVVGVDINKDIVEKLNAGRVLFSEPDLDGLVIRAVQEGSLTAQLLPCEADVFLIAVPTPINDDKTCDYRAVIGATRSIVDYIRPGSLVILESTVPPGTTEEVVQPILEESGLKAGKDFHLAFCPERVLPGRIITELINNDRVIGGIDKASAEKAADFYSHFVRGELYQTDLRTAEVVKLVENSSRDVSIAFANEVSLIADKLGIDAWEVIKLANRHPRVNILNPGPGVGGHCIAVDPWFLVEKAPAVTSVILAARQRNDSMPHHVVSRIAAVCKPGAKIACLGVTYKADVDDIRESPAIEIVHELKAKGFNVHVVDSHVASLDGIPLVSLDEALDAAECVALLVDHAEFKRLNPVDLRSRFGAEKVIDTRGIWR